MAKCIKCDHDIISGVCEVDTCKCICEIPVTAEFRDGA